MKVIVILKSKFNVTNALMPECVIQLNMLDESHHKERKPWKLCRSLYVTPKHLFDSHELYNCKEKVNLAVITLDETKGS